MYFCLPWHADNILLAHNSGLAALNNTVITQLIVTNLRSY